MPKTNMKAEASVASTSKNKNETENIKDFLCRLLPSLFFHLRYYLDFLIDIIFGLYFNRRNKHVCLSYDPILLESATSLARKIRNRELKVEKIVLSFVRRIEEVNPYLNAVVDTRFTEAIEEAKKIDEQIANGEITDSDFQQKPFLGVPFTSKESTACLGMSHTIGLLSRKGAKANRDSEIVKLLKEAGGILLGVTNIPQLNTWQETFNPLFGRTNNPYNITRTVGGSSGGEGCILAAGGSALGIGTDLGGSLRIPSFMCGIFGHKPTCNEINTRGMTFRTGNEKKTMIVAGTMTRFAEDISPLLQVLFSENAMKFRLNEIVSIEEIKIYYVQEPGDYFVCKIRNEMRKAMQNVVRHFDEILPCKSQEVKFSGTRYGGRLWRYWKNSEKHSGLKRNSKDDNAKVSSVDEIIRYFSGKSDFCFSTLFFIILTTIFPQDDPNWMEEETKKLKNEILDTLGTNGVLLYPSAPWPASYHYTAFLRPWNCHLFAIWNALKLPVTQIPLGLGSSGLPLGLQAVTAPYNDRLTIAVAKHLEKQFGGYVPPFISK